MQKIHLIPLICSEKEGVKDRQLILVICVNILQTGALELKPYLIEVQANAFSELNPHNDFNWDNLHRYQRLPRVSNYDWLSGSLSTKS